eukprot:augustus_masked-scaffold_101-processed-gene-0.8-mRNA-1 protein AED:1.00 eAED:1.00 QI:0/0/0/0/1/1/2/0/179
MSEKINRQSGRERKNVVKKKGKEVATPGLQNIIPESEQGKTIVEKVNEVIHKRIDDAGEESESEDDACEASDSESRCCTIPRNSTQLESASWPSNQNIIAEEANKIPVLTEGASEMTVRVQAIATSRKGKTTPPPGTGAAIKIPSTHAERSAPILKKTHRPRQEKHHRVATEAKTTRER